MSDGRRFGFVSKRKSNYVTTREYGDIPGILVAQDVFVSIPLEDMQLETAKRAEQFCNALQADWETFQHHPMHRTDVTLSIIKNPSKAYQKEV